MTVSRVLFVIGSLGVGGAESQMAALMRGLADRDWRCELFALEPMGPLREVMESYGVVIHDGGYDCSGKRWRRVLQLVRALYRLISLSLRTKPDVLHAYLPLTNFLGALAGRMSGVGLVITSRRALGTHQDRHPLWKPFDRAANLLSHYVTANSRAVAADTIRRDGVDPKKLRLIFNGIDFEKFEKAAGKREMVRQAFGMGPADLGVVAVGNLISYKGHADLVSAWSDVVKAYPSARLFLVGEDRGIGDDLRRMAEELKISNQLALLGRRGDVAEVMAGMDVFVMPSHEEGFSNALLEAMASGLATVATEVGGNPEALEGGRLGILVPPRDPASLAAALKNLLANRGARLEFGEHAKRAVREKYTVAAMVDAHVALYRR
jgi:glycosyltransferase involved in cell wall biosynthesis